ncbi:MAG: sugar isomerase, partial [Planctomycetota bacterium]
MNRRDFIKTVGFCAAAVGTWRLSSQAWGGLRRPIAGMGLRMGRGLRVKPVLVYQFFRRREATSWRPWGGLHNQSDVDAEAQRITNELGELSSSADFSMEVLPLARVGSETDATAAGKSDCDVILVYAASGERRWLEILAGGKKPSLMFLRHKSGPVYLWYEIAHPRFLRKTTDEFKEPGMDVWDIVVDDYDEVLWRLRALYGLKNTMGTKIVAIGDASGWGEGGRAAPQIAREVWKLDIRPVAYSQLGPMLKDIRADEKAVRRAQRDTDEYLAQRGVSLHTEKKFLVNAFLLTAVFKRLMEEADAPAITVNHCMGTIMPMAETTACMTLSLLNDEGLIAFCESDFVVIPAGILLRYISGKPSFFNDPTHPHDGITTCAHCTAPRRMNGKDLEPVKVMTQVESDNGASPKVQFRKGQVVTNVVHDFACKN